MIVVYLWLVEEFKIHELTKPLNMLPAYVRERLGHASLSVTVNEGKSEYLSFWPLDENKFVNSLSVKSQFLNNYQEDDTRIEGAKHEHCCIKITLPNEEEVYKFISCCKHKNQQKNNKYHLLYQNCSTFVADALRRGANIQENDDAKFKKYALPCHKETLCSSIDTGNKFLERLDLPFVKNFVNAGEHIINQNQPLIWTPKTVWNFVRDIQDIAV